MSRVLWLTPEVPEPGGIGGAIRTHHLLGGLVRRGLRPVVVATSYADQAERARATTFDGVELVLVPRPESRAKEALREHLRHPSLVGPLLSRPFLGWQGEVFWREIEETVQRELAEPPAAVVVEHDFCVQWGRRIPATIPATFASNNATWTQIARDADAAPGVRGALLGAEAARYRRHLRGALSRYSLFSACSEQDAVALGEFGVGPVEVFPNGADTSRLAGIEATGGEPGRLLFTGTLSYPPNADAVRWLATEILPLIRRSEPDARLTVVGRGAPADVEQLAAADPAIDLLGWVDDLTPLLASAAVALAPLRSGGGTRLKIVEALAAGRAMVSTTIGAEGIDVTDDVHLRIADDAAGFAEVVVELLRDREARVRLAEAGRGRARERYDWTAIADGFAASLAGWAGTP
ncbi:MAG: glycosyltransferase [Solirubrobacteraceae bacterium]|nr:glycosyltransferase [Solirubrobacteraceae bacterium]